MHWVMVHVLFTPSCEHGDLHRLTVHCTPTGSSVLQQTAEIILSQGTATSFILSTCVFSIKCGKGANPQPRALDWHLTAQPVTEPKHRIDAIK